MVHLSGLVWARLGGSSSSQILRETLLVRKTLQLQPPEETPSVEKACQVIPPVDVILEKACHVVPPVEVILGTW